jgi:DNA-binding CsgD family transcriptional regulator
MNSDDHYQIDPNQLTVREDILVCWVTMGMTLKEMARKLNRRVKTVNWYLGRINRKLGFNNPVKYELVKLNQTV